MTNLFFREALLSVGATQLAKELVIGQKSDARFHVGTRNAPFVIPSLTDATLEFHFSNGSLFVAVTVDRVCPFGR